MRRQVRWALIGVLLAACRAAPPETRCAECDEYATSLQTWREERLAGLRGPQGWLALAGLRWLEDGEYRLGADPAADIVFPEGAPATIGTLTRRGGEVRLRVAAGVDARSEGRAIEEIGLRSDADPSRPADRVQIGGRFTFVVIARGERLALRWYDAESPERKEFAGIEAFPVAARWRVRARFEAFAAPRTIEHPTVVGTGQTAEIPGVAVFSIDGREHRLTPILERGAAGPELLFVFSDATRGVETYRGGRFLVVPLPRGEALELDFNRAHNPPCAFTPYATCPVPREENHLPVRVEAGEKTPFSHAP